MELHLSIQVSDLPVICGSGGGFWGVSAGVSAGFAQNESGQSVDASATEGHQLNVSYNVSIMFIWHTTPNPWIGTLIHMFWARNSFRV